MNTDTLNEKASEAPEVSQRYGGAKILESLQTQIDTSKENLRDLERIRSFVVRQPITEELPAAYLFGDTLDFDNLSHGDIIKVIKAFPGRWLKEPAVESAKINYSVTIDGIKIRCYSGEPPANCKIVEEQVVIPAQPERTEIRKRLVCTKNQ